MAPAQVIAQDGPDVIVDQDGRRRHATTLLVGDVAVGDWVVIGSGAVLRRLDPAEADALLDTIHAAEAIAAAEGGPS